MKRLVVVLACCLAWVLLVPPVAAAEAAPESTTTSAAEAEKQRVTAAAAAAATAAAREVHAPDFLEQLVDLILSLFDIHSSGNTAMHYVIAGLFLIAGLVLRRVVTVFVFRQLRRIAARTTTTIDDKLFNALEPPAATFVMLVGIFAALKVLKLTPALDRGVAYGATVAFTLVVFWAMIRALTALLDHAEQMARARQLGVAAFMPWIKKTIATVFIIFGILMVIQSFGYDVKAILAGLGIGSLAVALAAQDSLANIFGAIVVAVDQPFKIGETVRIGPNVGGVEDIGLRSTRIRLIDKSLMVIPNKTVAAEPITNLSRFTRRRFEQVIGLTYRTAPEQMDEIVKEIKRIITTQPEVDAPGVMVFFRDFSASSLDIWVVYELPSPDFQKAMAVKQRINLEIMRAVEARGLSFAFPTQTIEFAGPIAEKMAEAHSGNGGGASGTSPAIEPPRDRA